MSLLLSLQNAHLENADKVILDDVNWQIHTGQRFALIGRNGVGKSTLMKVLSGDVALDKGLVQSQKGLKIAQLPQDLSKSYGDNVFADIFYRTKLQNGLPQNVQISDFFIEHGILNLKSELHDDFALLDFVRRCNEYIQVMQLELNALWKTMSGGMKRRCTLVAALLSSPDVLLLDEPTNHLDIQAIVWLEQFLMDFKGAVVFVTHDRYFLKAVANHIVALESGYLRQYNDGYEAYLNQRAAELAAFDNENNRLKQKLAAEEHWLQRGVTARRTRNQGRLQALLNLRKTVAERQKNIGLPGHWNPQVIRSGRVLLTAEHLNFSYANQTIIKDFSFILMRGDKLGIVGPNGCGKTTLARMLLGEIKPQSGSIKYTNTLEPIYFDQMQKLLDTEKTVMYNIADGAEYVELPHGKTHIAGYLKDFMFMPDQLQRPVSSLSGGERQRLMLAKCLAKQGNLMVFDEPSNDLDLESLEQLASMMVDYNGTFILVSHDRALIEDVVTRLLVWEAPGVFKEILPQEWDPKTYVKPKAIAVDKITPEKQTSVKTNLNYNEQKELKKLPDEIAKLEEKIASIHQKMADPNFYQSTSTQSETVLEQLKQFEDKLDSLYARWEILEAKGDA
jgi:ATP-binding cassette subfamily F protein uup